VLENGMTWNQTSANPEDAQFLQSREFQIREVARWFGVPVSKLMEAGSGLFQFGSGKSGIPD
jgi:phage portal protein BeeE